MDRRAAREVLQAALAGWRALSHQALVQRIGEVEARPITGPDGKEYQIEIEAFWDDRPGGDIRILGSVDDGGWSAFAPLCEDFLVSPPG